MQHNMRQNVRQNVQRNVQPNIPPRYPAPRPPKPSLSAQWARTVARFRAYLPRNLGLWMMVAAAVSFFLVSMTIVAIVIGAMVIYGSGRILPGVSVAGIPLGGLTLEEAEAQLRDQWSEVSVRDGQRWWKVSSGQLGLSLDAGATALAAQHHGRSDGLWLAALVGSDGVVPVVSIDSVTAEQGFKALSQTVDAPAQNATVRIVDGGNAVAVPAVEGRVLDVRATLDQLLVAQGSEFADGAIDLFMNVVQPSVTDASGLVEQAKGLLASPLTINAYDPINNQNTGWVLPPDQWGQWLTTENTASGVKFSVEVNALSNFLNGQATSLGEGRFLDVAKSVELIRNAVGNGQPSAMIQVKHQPTKYVVASGDTIGTIAWKTGVQMWRIAKANPTINVNGLSVGQEITIPSRDELLPKPIVFNKRVVVSIPNQRMVVYENGQVKWDWPASTGIPDSPTAPGVFQIQGRYENAYAGNWNLWMPYFMDIYEAVPGFMNGIHGFPTRNGQGILWQGNLGSRVTYGCILVSTQNAQLLYDWAEDGVVVEIQG